MSLYFENPVNFPETGAISTNGVWHPNAALLAIASYSQEKGGFVTIFDELVSIFISFLCIKHVHIFYKG